MHFVSARLGTSLVVWLLVGIALALPSGLLLIQVNLAALTAGWEGRPGLTVYFELDATQAQVEAAAEVLNAERSVEGVVVTSREQALEEFRAFTNLTDALDMLGDNPLPASLNAALETGLSEAALAGLVAVAESRPGVQEVVLEKTWLERVNDISRWSPAWGSFLAGCSALARCW
jgi:cell division transport system permease protein